LGYTANPDSVKYLDSGVGGFLAGAQNPNREWAAMAKSFAGKFKTPTLRDVDQRPRPDFLKAYMHNGYLKSLKEVVHFYNTRDTLPTCKPGDRGEKVTCWPAPEYPQTINRNNLAILKLDRRAGRPVGNLSQDPNRWLPASGPVAQSGGGQAPSDSDKIAALLDLFVSLLLVLD